MPTPRGPPPVGTTISFLKRATTATPKPSALTQQTVSSYRLQWDKLRRYLETKFSKDKYPDYVLDKARVINQDRYVFMVPEALNSRDEFEIELLRDTRSDNALDREQSPEP